MPTTHATSLTNGEIVEENDLGSIRRVTAGGVTFQSLHECRDRQGGWVLHGQVSVVGVAVELEQRGVEFGARGALGVLGEGERVVGEHRPAVLGYEHQMGMQRRHAVPGAAVGLGCHRSALQSEDADALPVPH
jgi:hypothetical protein